MFKKLKDRIVEEVTNSRFQAASTSQDLLDLSDSAGDSSTNQKSSHLEHFSLVEDEESSEQSQSQNDQNSNFESIDLSDPTCSSTPNPASKVESSRQNDDESFLPMYTPPPFSLRSYQSDLESASEMEEPSVTLDRISKEQLLQSFLKARKRYLTYKSKYGELLESYRQQMEDKEKMKGILSESQDKALRRISELKEESKLASAAKVDLEETYQLMLDEKDEQIHVLKTQVHLLKGEKVPEKISREDNNTPLIDLKDTTKTSENDSSNTLDSNEHLEKLKTDLNYNISIVNTLTDENNTLLMQVEDLKNKLQVHQAQLKQFDHDEENMSLKIAEVKREMHEQIELKDQQLAQMSSQIKRLLADTNMLEAKIQKKKDIIKLNEEARKREVSDLRAQLISAEQTLEDEKQALVQELSRGKAAAVALLQEQMERSVKELKTQHELEMQQHKKNFEHEIKIKLENLKKEHSEVLINKEKEKAHALNLKEEEMRAHFIERASEMNLALEERDLQKMAALSTQELKLDELREEINKLKQENKDLKETLLNKDAKFEKEICNWQKAGEELHQNHARESEQLNIQYQSRYSEMESEIKTLKEKISNDNFQHETEITSLKAKFEDLLMKSKTAWIEQHVSELEDLKGHNDKQHQQKLNELKKAQMTILELTESLQTIEEKVADFNLMKDDYNNLQEILRDRNQELQNTRGFKESLLPFFLKIQKQCQDLISLKEKNKLNATEMKNVIEEIESYKNKIEGSLLTYTNMVLEKEELIDGLQTQLTENQVELEKMNDELHRQKTENASLASMVDQMKVFQESVQHQIEGYEDKINAYDKLLSQSEESKNFMIEKVNDNETQRRSIEVELEQVKLACDNEHSKLLIETDKRLAAEKQVQNLLSQLEENEKLKEDGKCRATVFEEQIKTMKEQLDCILEENHILSLLSEKLEKEAQINEQKLREKDEELQDGIHQLKSLQDENELQLQFRNNLQCQFNDNQQIIAERDSLIGDLQRQRDEAVTNLECAKAKLSEVNKNVAQNLDAMKRGEILLREELDKLRLELNENKQQYQDQISHLMKDLDSSSEQLQNLEEQNKKLQLDLGISLDEIRKKDEELCKHKQELVSYNDSVMLTAKHDKEITKLNKQYETFFANISHKLKINFDVLTDSVLDNLFMKIGQLISDCAEHEKDKERLDKELNKMKLEIQNREEEVLSLKTTHAEHLRIIRDCTRQSIMIIRDEMQHLSHSIKVNAKELSEYKRKIDEKFHVKLKEFKEAQDQELQTVLQNKHCNEEVLQEKIAALSACENKLQEITSENDQLIMKIQSEVEKSKKMEFGLTDDLSVVTKDLNLLKHEMKNEQVKVKNLQEEKKNLEILFQKQVTTTETLAEKSKQLENNLKLNQDQHETNLETMEKLWKDKLNEEKKLMDDELMSIQQQYICQLEESKKKIEHLEDEKDFLTSELEGVNKLKTSLEIDLEEMKKKLLQDSVNLQASGKEVENLVKKLEKSELELNNCKQILQTICRHMLNKMNDLKNDLHLCREVGVNHVDEIRQDMAASIMAMTPALQILLKTQEQLQSQLNSAEQNVVFLQGSKDKVSAELIETNRHLSELSKSNSLILTEKESLESEIQSLRNNIQEQEASAKRMTIEHKHLLEEQSKKFSEELQLRLGDLKKKAELKLGHIKKQLQVTNDERVVILQQENETLNQKLASLELEHKNTTDTISENEKLMFTLKDESDLLQQKLINLENDYKKDLAQFKSEKEQLLIKHQEESEKMQRSLEDIQIRNNKLAEKLYSMKENIFKKITTLDSSQSDNEALPVLSASAEDNLEGLGNEIHGASLEADLGHENTQQEIVIDGQFKFSDIELVEQKIENVILAYKNEKEIMAKEIEMKNTQIDESLIVAEETRRTLEKKYENTKQENRKLAAKLLKAEEQITEFKQTLNESLHSQEESSSESVVAAAKSPDVCDEIQKLTTAYEEKIHFILEEKQRMKDELRLLKLATPENEAENTNAEDQHVAKIKQLARDFSAHLEKREQEFQNELSEALGKERDDKSRMLIEHKALVSELQEIVKEKDATLDSLLESERTKFKDVEENLKEKLQQYETKLSSQEAKYHQSLTDIEKKWKRALKKQTEELVEQREEEVSGLTEEWKRERIKKSENKLFSSQQISSDQLQCHSELEKENKLTLAAMESSHETNELLRKQIMALNSEISSLKEKHQAEVGELRHLLQTLDGNANRGGAVGNLRYNGGAVSPLFDEPTEMEYLKNILYHYMMGRQTTTLAKVIAAVVKFSGEQTQEILDREEAKNSTLSNFLKSS